MKPVPNRNFLLYLDEEELVVLYHCVKNTINSRWGAMHHDSALVAIQDRLSEIGRSTVPSSVDADISGMV